jgi:hypothetical protein
MLCSRKFNLLVANKILCTTLIIILATGCYQAESSLSSNNQNKLKNSLSAQLKNSFSLKVNQVAFIKSENLELKLLEVKKDSRCPAETQCIWTGLVEIVIKVKKNNRDIDLILIDKGENSNSTTKVFDNYFVKLIEITPYPQKNQTINTKDYSAKLMVSRQ